MQLINYLQIPDPLLAQLYDSPNDSAYYDDTDEGYIA